LLIKHLNGLPEGLAAHVKRVQIIARDLAKVHGVDPDIAELTAAAHDVARHINPKRLLEEAEKLGLKINSVERYNPILLHGAVGSAWLEADGSIENREVLEGVRWHTTSHPDLSQVGQVVMLADKLDPVKAKKFPFQEDVRNAAFKDLKDGTLVFLEGVFKQQQDRKETFHPAAVDTRNSIILATYC